MNSVAGRMPSMLQDPPEVDAAAAVGILRDRYRIDAEVRPLRSERDRNFLAVGRDAQQLVLKVSNSGDDPAEIVLKIRPPLIWETEHVDHFLAAFSSVVAA
jgi:Ser/Thr protein kinase RdoA (MazF antagonist)